MMQQNFHTSPMQMGECRYSLSGGGSSIHHPCKYGMQIFIEWGWHWESDQYVMNIRLLKPSCCTCARLSHKTLVGIYQEHIEESSNMDTCQLHLQWALGIPVTSLDVQNGLWGTRYFVINMHVYKLMLFSECLCYFQSWAGLGSEYILL